MSEGESNEQFINKVYGQHKHAKTRCVALMTSGLARQPTGEEFVGNIVRIGAEFVPTLHDSWDVINETLDCLYVNSMYRFQHIANKD